MFEFSCDVCNLGEDWFLLILALTSLLGRLKFALYASMQVLLVKIEGGYVGGDGGSVLADDSECLARVGAVSCWNVGLAVAL